MVDDAQGFLTFYLCNGIRSQEKNISEFLDFCFVRASSIR